MKSSDLKIGNHLNKNGVRVVIDGRTIFDIWGFELKGVTETSYSPIKLTERILINFGFKVIEEIQGLKYYWLDDIGLFSVRESKYNDRAYDLIVHNGTNSTIYIMSFDFAHEIQNYFSLINKPLTSN